LRHRLRLLLTDVGRMIAEGVLELYPELEKARNTLTICGKPRMSRMQAFSTDLPKTHRSVRSNPKPRRGMTGRKTMNMSMLTLILRLFRFEFVRPVSILRCRIMVLP